MNGAEDILDVATLRREFDEAFTKPAQTEAKRTIPLLAVRAAGTAVALELSAIKAIQLSPPITEIPSEAPALLGVAAVRGVIAAMYSLAQLLGLSNARGAGGWSVTCGDGSVGLVFDELSGFERITPEEVKRSAGGERFASGFVEIGGSPHLLVNFAALIEEITGAPINSATNQGAAKDV